jgi:hypothetical protein
MHGLARPCLASQLALLVPVGSKPNKRFRRLTCLKLVGTALIVGAPPLEHPRAAPRIAIRNPSAPLSRWLYHSLPAASTVRQGKNMVLGPSLAVSTKVDIPANAYARKSPRVLNLELTQSNLRKRSKGEKNLFRAGGWTGVAYW